VCQQRKNLLLLKTAANVTHGVAMFTVADDNCVRCHADVAIITKCRIKQDVDGCRFTRLQNNCQLNAHKHSINQSINQIKIHSYSKATQRHIVARIHQVLLPFIADTFYFTTLVIHLMLLIAHTHAEASHHTLNDLLHYPVNIIVQKLTFTFHKEVQQHVELCSATIILLLIYC